MDTITELIAALVGFLCGTMIIAAYFGIQISCVELGRVAHEIRRRIGGE